MQVKHMEVTHRNEVRQPDSGFTIFETMIASTILTICSLGVVAMIANFIATDTRNKFDTTTMMLAHSIVEQIEATAVGAGTADLTDCAGNTQTIDTQIGGAQLNAAGNAIDFTETSPPANYRMVYVVKSPCTTTGIEQATYDLRWHIDLIGAGTSPKNTYVITVSAQMLNRGFGNMFFAAPVTLRLMLGD